MMPGPRLLLRLQHSTISDLPRQTNRPSMGKSKAKTKRGLREQPIEPKPACDQAKLRADLSTYMDVSGQLRAKRKEMFAADRRGTLKDRQARDMSVEVAKLKRSSDKLRLSVCEQLRSFIEEIHSHLAASPGDVVEGSDLDSRDKSSNFSVELADKCVELLHSVTITAIKEEIFEAKRLLHNVQLHDGRSAVYVMVRSRYRVRPRSW